MKDIEELIKHCEYKLKIGNANYKNTVEFTDQQTKVLQSEITQVKERLDSEAKYNLETLSAYTNEVEKLKEQLEGTLTKYATISAKQKGTITALEEQNKQLAEALEKQTKPDNDYFNPYGKRTN